MEQVAIITKLVQELIAMNSSEADTDNVEVMLMSCVSSLEFELRAKIRAEKKKQEEKEEEAWEARYACGEFDAIYAKEKEEQRAYMAKRDAEDARKKEAQRERRRELYQLKKAEKKAKEVDWRSKICKFCGGYNGGEGCVSCFGEKK
jgi:hypothetical protein